MKKIIFVTLLAVSTPAYAWTYYLVDQWVNAYGNRMCQYGDGSVYNMGINLCPLSIER